MILLSILSCIILNTQILLLIKLLRLLLFIFSLLLYLSSVRNIWTLVWRRLSVQRILIYAVCILFKIHLLLSLRLSLLLIYILLNFSWFNLIFLVYLPMIIALLLLWILLLILLMVLLLLLLSRIRILFKIGII